MSRGFTVVELVVVLVLVAILALAALPRFSQSVIELSGEAEQLAADIRYAQTLSMARGQRHCVFFSGNTYQFRTLDTTTSTHCAATALISHPATGSSTPIGFSGVTISTPDFPNGYVEFATNGKPYVSAAVSLASNATVTLTASGRTRNVVVSPETGKATVQ